MTDIDVSVSDNIALITFNRPERLNAMTTSMCDELFEAFDKTDSDDTVRAVVVTGAGRAFCAGADLSSGDDAFDRAADDETGVPRDAAGKVTLRIFESLKPVIGAINGAAVGFGASLILPMDIRIAAERARFSFPFTARGILPDGASSWFLPRIVGVNTALEWMLSARLFDAAEAQSSGLVRSLHPDDQVLDVAIEIAHGIAASAAPVSAALTRQLLWQMLTASHPMDAHEIESAGLLHTGTRSDAAEGVKAFLEKRTPSWSLSPGTDLPDWYPWSRKREFDGKAYLKQR